jgi:hypothetical protein
MPQTLNLSTAYNRSNLDNQTLSQQDNLSVYALSLDGPGVISQDQAIAVNEQIQSLNQLRNDIIDYVRLRLGDQIVDVELDKEHYDLAIKQALTRYRQRAGNAVEESFVFLDLLPETQEYILPNYIDTVKAIYRRGIGSVTGTTASQFEPFAAGYLNTYMLVAGRVGGLVNYELFSQYQELAMTMFGGYINYTWNKVTKKLSLVRKLPAQNITYFKLSDVTITGTTVGSDITFVLQQEQPVVAGDTLFVKNSELEGYNAQYRVKSVTNNNTEITVEALQALGSALTSEQISKLKVHSPQLDGFTESVILHVFNIKPDSMLISDPQILPWIQDYALAFCKGILGQARSKFSSVAGPQGAGQLNGTALLAESQQEMDRLDEEIKRYIDGSAPLTWITG